MKHYFLFIRYLFYKALRYYTFHVYQERSNVKSIPERQGSLTPGKKTKNDLNFKENDLKLQYYVILKLQLEALLKYFKIRNLRKQKVSQIQKVSKFWHFENINIRE